MKIFVLQAEQKRNKNLIKLLTFYILLANFSLFGCSSFFLSDPPAEQQFSDVETYFYTPLELDSQQIREETEYFESLTTEPVQQLSPYEPPTIYNEYGETQIKDYTKLISILEQVAQKGSAYAQYFLAMMYKENPEIQQDQDLVFYWMQQAAEQGFAPAQYELAMMYKEDAETQQDQDLAFYWMQQAAKQRFISAQFELAMMQPLLRKIGNTTRSGFSFLLDATSR